MSERIESPKKTNSNNNDYLTKLAVLRNAIIDERKKREEIEKKLVKLEEDNKIIQKENDEIKIDNTMKGELIEKLKLELRNYRNKNGQKGVQRFLKNLFEEEEEIHADEKQENDIKEDQISFLKKENDELKNKQSILEDEKKTLNIKLNEQIGENDKLKKDYEKKILEVKNSNIEKVLNLEKELNEKKNLINVFSERNQYFTSYTKTFDTQKTNLENEINKLKSEVKELKETNDNKDKILSDLVKDQQNLLQQIDEANKEKDDFKMLINQYKILIQELTPLNINHDFEGYILPKYEDEKRRRIQINFNKVQNGIYIKVDNKEVVFTKNDIQDFLIHYKFNEKIIIVFI